MRAIAAVLAAMLVLPGCSRRIEQPGEVKAAQTNEAEAMLVNGIAFFASGGKSDSVDGHFWPLGNRLFGKD